jgi:uncharacterized phiE125 gp8 family phage protein
MKRPPILIDPPAETPISVADVRARGRVDASVPDAVISAMIASATARLDGYSGRLGRALVSQKWQQDFAFPCRGLLRLPFPGVSAVSAVAIAPDGSEAITEVVAGEDVIGPLVRVVSWTSGSAVCTLRVTFTAGYGEPADVPAPIREAIHLYVQSMLDTAFGNGLIRTETVEGVGSTGYFTPDEAASPMVKLADDMVRQYRRGNL